MAQGEVAHFLVKTSLFSLSDLDDSEEIEIPRPEEERSENLLKGVTCVYFGGNIQDSEGIVNVIARNIEIESLKPELLRLWCCK